MSGEHSINRNKGFINENIAGIATINDSITDLRLGVATKDEKNKIKYTGHNDWRLKLEIYSNIDGTTVLNSNLLFDNSNSLEYVDYIHLLADSDEISISSNLKFFDYKSLTAENKVYRNYQDDTYQDYIISHKTGKLLLRYTLNILLKKDQDSPITTNFDSINLAEHIYFINYQDKGYDIRADGYSNLIKIHQPNILIEIYEEEIAISIEEIIKDIDYDFFAIGNLKTDRLIRVNSLWTNKRHYNYLICKPSDSRLIVKLMLKN